MLDDLPAPPAFAELVAWARPGRVVRASPADLAAWRLPPGQKTALAETGVPLLEGVVDAVAFRAGAAYYRLTEERHELGFAAEAGTGRIVQVHETGSHVRFVNSSVNHWLWSLHLVGTWQATSTAIHRWDEDELHEEAALAELSGLRDRIEALDPPSCAGGDHDTRYWPAILDRWLY
jgi:SUKH-4 immunity protein of toxin-antitoxin system